MIFSFGEDVFVIGSFGCMNWLFCDGVVLVVLFIVLFEWGSFFGVLKLKFIILDVVLLEMFCEWFLEIICL